MTSCRALLRQRCMTPQAAWLQAMLSLTWVALKFPGGGTYAFIDAHSLVVSGSYPWRVAYSLDEPIGNPLAATLQQLYPPADADAIPAGFPVQDDVAYSMWNDEFPGGSVWLPGAHAKGVLAYGMQRGFWLLHSVPKFPAAPCERCPDGGRGYTGIAPAQKVYGQSFACITAAAEQLDLLALAAGTSGVYIYDAHVPEALRGRLPAAEALIAAAPRGRPAIVPGAPSQVAAQLTFAAGGQALAAFAKAPSPPAHPVALYEDLVGPFFKSAMLWETWQHGEASPQECGSEGNGSFSSFTVAALEVPDGARWDVYQDHAKWGVTVPAPPPCCRLPRRGSPLGNAVCLADQNRQTHQHLRGGGAICFLGNDPLWGAFRGIVTAVQRCEAPSTQA